MFSLDSFGPSFWGGFGTGLVILAIFAGVVILRNRVIIRRFVRCEDCHCTQERACHGGCAWNPAYLKLDRYICTACRPVGEGP